ncbi:MAG TPA: DUF2384 domain-containing protein [Actinobacteria bacterium]|nr:DUF2384 domain-containing protein [Actinomycetota bacterium]
MTVQTGSSGIATSKLGLTDALTRQKLTSAASPALIRLAHEWGLTDAQLADLLGGISVSTVRRWKRTPPEDLGFDGLTRASYLLGIYQALHVILDDVNADAWVRMPNDSPLFNGQSPVDVMTQGGILAMDRVRLHLDAVRGGR